MLWFSTSLKVDFSRKLEIVGIFKKLKLKILNKITQNNQATKKNGSAYAKSVFIEIYFIYFLYYNNELQ